MYEYKCKCSPKTHLMISKPMAESSKVEICKKCGRELVRVFTAPRIRTGDGLK